MDGGRVHASYEKLVIDVEMLQHMMEFLTPIEVSESTLGLDAIGRVPTGGHFFGDEHTIERYETAFYTPFLSDWRNWEAWTVDGAASATERATRLWQQALSTYEEPVMDDSVRDRLETYVAHRKEQIGDGEL